MPLGALSGMAVIAVVIGVSTLSGGFFTASQSGFSEKPSDMTSTTGGDGGSDVAAQATPFSVFAGEVQWVDTSANGSLAYNRASVDEVCPTEDTSGCPKLRDANQQDLAIVNKPRTIIESPTNGQAVAVADGGASGGEQIIIFDLPEASPAPPPTPIQTPTPVATSSVAPTGSPSLPRVRRRVPSPPPTPTPTPMPTPTEATGSSTPSPTPVDATATPSPTVSPAVPSPSPSPLLSPTPSIAISIAIASDIELVGESAAFSADGAWFAFTARPGDRSRGPDVYVWQVGDASARQITTDGSTVFASWDGEQDRGEPTPPRTVEVGGERGRAGDGAHRSRDRRGIARPGMSGDRSWTRPSSRAIGWTGSLTLADDGSTWTPGDGTLELRDWSADGAQRQGSGQGRGGLVVADAAKAGFDVRWDEAGDWVAIWIADPGDPTVGRLSLYRVDIARGRLELAQGRAGRCAGTARLLDRRRPARLGDAARPGRRGQPGPDRGLERGRRRFHRERPRRGRRHHPLIR